jgi:hypothetical protein
VATWLVADIYNGDYIAETGRRDHWSEEILRKNDETTQLQREGFSKAVKAGVKIAFGTDSGVYPHGGNARQFTYMVRFGLSPMDADSRCCPPFRSTVGERAGHRLCRHWKIRRYDRGRRRSVAGHRQAAPG